MPVESLDGVKLHIQTLGHAGETVVLVHGMTTTLASLYFTIAPGIAETRRVLMYDLRGHGKSEMTTSGYGIGAMAGDLARVIDRHGMDTPLSIVGHSFGAAVALRYTLDHPGRVRRLVFAEGPLPVFLTDEEPDDAAPGSGAAPAAGPRRIAFAEGPQQVFITQAGAAASWRGEDRSEEVIATITNLREIALQNLSPTARNALAGTGRRARQARSRASRIVNETTLMDDIAQDQDIPDAEIARCDCPVLLCYGTRTLPEMAATCKRLSALLPDVRVRMFDSGHLMLNEVPGQLQAAVIEFLDG